MVPSAFVELPALPLLPNGKVDRKALPAPPTPAESKPDYDAALTPRESILLGIWRDVLRLDSISIHDNFFELGGDSILSIQVVARTSQAGLRITPKQLFQNQTIAELARVAVEKTNRQPTAMTAIGPIPLTPIQHWFFEQDIEEASHFNQSVLIQVPADVNPELMAQAVQHIYQHHDGLRLRFSRSGDIWTQQVSETASSAIFSFENLSNHLKEERAGIMADIAGRAERSLDIENGPLMRVCLFGFGEAEPARLWVVIHHLAVDGVSWRILLEDIYNLYEQLSHGQEVLLPPKTTSFKEWAHLLIDHARSAEGKAEAEYWLEALRLKPKPIPVDRPPSRQANRIGDTDAVIISLGETETLSLLQEVPQAYNTRINDVLLTALALAFQQSGGGDSLLVDFESHGRREFKDHIDLSRTVGWFTTISPVLVQVEADAPLGETLKSVKEQIRRIPEDGFAYMLHKYLSPDAELRSQLRALSKPEIMFNYLGQTDLVLPPSSGWSPAPEDVGTERAPSVVRSHLLEIVAMVAGGQLQVNWIYSKNIHDRETIDRIARRFVEMLRALVRHCCAPASRGFTPADFPQAKLNQRDLDKLAQLITERNPNADKDSVTDIYELSPMQRGLIFHSLFDLESPSYFEQLSCTIEGDLNTDLLASVWQRVLERHAALRTGFFWHDLAHPVQVVFRSLELPWEFYDWRSQPASERQQAFDAFLARDRARGFDLGKAPLFRCTLIREGETTHRFCWSHHHILLDGWSASILMKEVFEAYDSVIKEGKLPTLAPPQLYRGYIEWLQAQENEQAAAYWLKTMKGFYAPTPLPEDPTRRAPVGGRTQQEVSLLLTEEFTEQISAKTKSLHITLNSLIRGAWALLLSRYSGEPEVVFGVTVAGRPPLLEGIESMVGLFINTLPVRFHIKPEDSLASWLEDIHQSQADLDQYAYSSLIDIQKWSDIPAGTPLFNTLIAFQNYPVDRSFDRRPGGLRMSDVRVFDQTNYPLTLTVIPGERMFVHISYDSERFERDTIERLLEQLHALFAAFALDPSRPLRHLSLISPAARALLLESFNQTNAPFDPSLSFVRRFELLAESAPDHTVVSCSGRHLSRAQLNARANRLARHLRRLCPRLGTDDLVALLCRRSERMMEAVLAVWKCGAAYVPIEAGDPAARIRALVAESGVKLIITESGLLSAELAAELATTALLVNLDELPHELDDSRPALDSSRPTSDESHPASDDSRPASDDSPFEPHDSNLAVVTRPNNLAYVIYTSGSTGKPKGAMVEQAGMLNHLLAKVEDLHLTHSSVVAQTASHCFDISVWQFFAAALAGGRTVIYPDEVVMEPARLLAAAEADGVTVLEVVPSYLGVLLPRLEEKPTALKGLEYLMATGETLMPALAASWFKLSATPIINAYGPTEASDDITHYRMEEAGAEVRAVPVGRPLRNLRIYVVDEWLNLCGVGVKGEVCVAGVGVGRGYLHDAWRTAAAFVPDPFGELAGERMYRTGDVGSWLSDGRLLLHGRMDYQVKIRGHRVELGEIENALTQLDCVQEAVARDFHDEAGHSYLCGYVTLKAGRQADAATLARSLAEKLPDYMVPTAFVLLDQLPLTQNGKIDRHALPAPDLSKETRKIAYAAPRTSAERTLCLIWSEVLRVERPGIHDNFFALGGDSILSMQIVSRAGRAGLKLLTSQVFEHQTIAELARVATPMTRITGERGEIRGPLPLTPIQQRFFLQGKPEQHHYNQSLMIETTGDLDPAIVRQALQKVVSHHDALRLRFHLEGDHWFQQIEDAEGAAALQVEDISLLPADEQRRQIEVVCADAHAGLNLSTGPLLRSVLFLAGGEQKSRLLLVAHHLIMDGVSWGILLEELSAAYRQLQSNEVPRLPEKTTTFGEWAALLAESVKANGDLDREYWHSLESVPVTPLPLDEACDLTMNVVGSAEEITSSLSEEATTALLQQTPRAYNTRINDLLLAALALTLKDWTGEGQILVDLEGHGREPWIENADLSRTIGWFTTLFPIRLHVAADSLEVTIKSVKEELRLTPSKGLTYGILRYLADDSMARAQPTAQVVFNYLGQMDALVPAGSQWTLASESTGSGRSPKQQREYLFEVNSYILDGRLHTSWGYSRNLHRETTVRRLADSYFANLEKLIAHCLEPAAFGFTPSDFPVARVSQASLDELARQLETTPRQSLRDEVEDIYELTPTQQGMLFHSLYAPSSEAYFNQLTCLIEGELDTEAFFAAWQQTVERHPVLRTSFHWDGIEKPVQVVHRNVSLPWNDMDISGLDETDALERWREQLRQSRMSGFKTSEAPLMSWTIAHLGQSRWRFNWSQHHLLLDGWSSSLVLGEVLEAYATIRAGREAMLPRPRPFREMVKWLQQQDASGAERFWKERLSGFTTPTPLVLGRPEMEGERAPEAYAEKEILLSPNATSRLVSFAQSNQLSLNTLGQGAWSLLLSRYSGETDVVYGTIVSGRPPDLDGSSEMVGLFINSVPVRVQFDESEPALLWLKRMQATLVEQEQHAYSPLAEIQNWSEVPGGTPLFESLLIFQNYPVQEALDKPVTGVRISEFQVFDPNNYPLTLVVTPGEVLSLRALYDAGRFDEATIARLLSHYQTILEGIVAAPDQPVEKIELPTTAERERILSEWNHTAAEVPAGKTVVDLFESHAANTPERVALVCGSVSRTYRELSERSSALAQYLQEAAPIEPDDRVVIFMERSQAMVESILAIWKCGAAYVPVDPNYPAERVGRILADAKPRLIITESAAALANLPPEAVVVCLDAVFSSSPVAVVLLQSKASPHGLAYVIYTSGSTGRPKGAMVEHRGMLNHILGMVRDLEITEQSVVAETASHCFDISVWQFFAALISGARTHIYPDRIVLQPDGVTVVQFVPSYLAAFIDEMRSVQPPHSLSHLKFMVLIGEILKPSYVRAWFALYPDVRMMNAYGPTEASDSITHFIMDAPPRFASIPVGRPVQNLKIYILDKRMRLCPVGVRGEICVAGVGVGRGYLFDLERTNAVFEPDPFNEGGRLYHTGDIGCYAHDGNILFFGRKDFQVKIRGHRIELGDVESAITGIDGINNAAVVAREEADGGMYLCAYVSQSDAADWSAASLRDALRRKLPAHMLPDAWVILPELPLTPNGKVNRQALPEPAGQSAARSNHQPPVTRVEKVLAAIWQDVLGRQIGVEDRFFEIGGHSLHALRIVSRIRRDLGVDATLAQLFACDTVRALARELSNSPSHETTMIPALPDQAWYAVSHAQKRIWLACRTAEASIAYNMAAAFRLEGRLNPSVLVAALKALVERHESLRTVFAFADGELKQQIRSAHQSMFDVAQIDAPSSIDDLIATEAAGTFNLAEGPLFRATLARISVESHVLLLTMHHIISDAWSVRALIKELRVIYDAFCAGNPSPFEPLSIQYRDYAAWHNQLLESQQMHSHRDYWKRLLRPDMPRLELPLDYPRTAHNGRVGGRVASLIEPDTADGLSRLAQGHGTSLFGAVLASICVLLYRYTGQQEIVVGFQSTGRDQHQLEDQIGVYLNTVVLCARLEPAGSIAETVSSIGEALLGALAHSAYPFDLLLEELRVRTPVDRSPIFDVQIDYVPDLDPAHSADASPELAITDMSQDVPHTKYDISFLILESAGKMEVVTVYNANLFRRETVETMHQRLAVIQKAFLKDETRTISEIELFDEATRPAGKRVQVGLRLGGAKVESQRENPLADVRPR
jgi:amino acid adenylation domain-containing protein/non-ribosomal peptide synthase protein (TIGR01720 family)